MFQFKFDVGVCYSWYVVDGIGVVNLIGVVFVLIFFVDLGGCECDSQFIGKVVLNWMLSEDYLFYVFVVKGYKLGGIQSLVLNFWLEKVIDYEIGWKGIFLDGVVIMQFGGFYYDYKSFQFDVINVIMGQNLVINLISVKVKGIEGQVQVKLGGFCVLGGFGYIDLLFKGVQFVDICGVGVMFLGVSNVLQCLVGVLFMLLFCFDYMFYICVGGGGFNLFLFKWIWNFDVLYEF